MAPSDVADAQLRASEAAILQQEVAGIDVITGGEMHRRQTRQRRQLQWAAVVDSGVETSKAGGIFLA
jgi:hypothetical protein